MLNYLLSWPSPTKAAHGHSNPHIGTNEPNHYHPSSIHYPIVSLSVVIYTSSTLCHQHHTFALLRYLMHHITDSPLHLHVQHSHTHTHSHLFAHQWSFQDSQCSLACIHTHDIGIPHHEYFTLPHRCPWTPWRVHEESPWVSMESMRTLWRLHMEFMDFRRTTFSISYGPCGVPIESIKTPHGVYMDLWTPWDSWNSVSWTPQK